MLTTTAGAADAGDSANSNATGNMAPMRNDDIKLGPCSGFMKLYNITAML